MTESLVNELIKLPVKDRVEDMWIVQYRHNNHWVSKKFITDDGAYVFYYTKLREFQDAIKTAGKKERVK